MRSRLAVPKAIIERELIMRVVIAIVAATLMLTGCKRMVGPAPETPTGDQAAAAAANGDVVAPMPPTATDDMSAGQTPNPAVEPGAAAPAGPPATR
jgi:uncharacterized lipoprotein YajG